MTLPTVRFSRDGLHVFYGADQESDEAIELFRAKADGSGSVAKLNGALVTAVLGDVTEFASTSEGQRVVYRATTGLFGVPTDASSAAVRLDDIPGGGSWVASFALAPGDQRVVFISGSSASTVAELYSAPIDGSAPPIRLDGSLVPGGDVHVFRISPDGSRVAFVADKELDDQNELYVVPIDGSAPPLKLNDLLAPGDLIYPASLQISPDGTRAVYAPYLEEDLFSVALDGSSAPVKLNHPRGASSFRFSPDGTRVVYWTYRSVDANGAVIGDLLSVPTDGSASAVRINPESFGSTVVTLTYKVGASHVAFIANRPTGKYQLFSAPIDASSAPIRLNDALPDGANCSLSALSPAGTLAIYQADPSGLLELFSVSLDRSAPPLKLSHELEPGTEVGSFGPASVSPAGRHVLYRTMSTVFGYALDLYCAPIRGGSPAIRLNPALSGGNLYTNVYSASLSRDGVRVAYLARSDSGSRNELDTVPVWGDPTPTRLNGALIPPGDVTAFQLDPAGVRALYLADQEADETFELYASPLPKLKARPAR